MYTADDMEGAWHAGALEAVERVEAEADAARSVGAEDHATALRLLAHDMRAEFGLPPMPPPDTR